MKADSYIGFANSGVGQSIVNSLGLPKPVILDRYHGESDILAGQLLIGAAQGGELIGSVAAAAHAAEIDMHAVAGEAFTALTDVLSAEKKARAYQAEDEDGVKFKALVFDASGIKNSDQLNALYDFFHPVIRKMTSNNRIIVLGRTPELCTDPKQQTAQRALEGFVRCIGKEVRKGGTAQLIYVKPGAEAQMESSLRFFLSVKSAYVSAQVVRISDVKTAALKQIDWKRPLQGKTALVTGASRGIGLSIAEVLSRDGARVVCLDIPPAQAELEKVAKRIAGDAIAMDITAEATPAKLAEYFAEGGVDIIVHNAGVTRDKTLGRMKPDLWSSVIDINLSSEERINDALLAANAINKGGRIIGVSSISGIAGNMGQSNYGTSKAGVIGMVQSMAPILAKKGITINAVAPGFIETQMTAAIPFAIRQAGRRMNSMSQGGLPEDVAEAIAWYANPMSQGVTGNVVRVCGQNLLGA